MYNVVRSFLILTFFAANETKEMETKIWQQQYIYLLWVTTGFYILKFDHLDTFIFITIYSQFLFYPSCLDKGT